MSVRSNPADRSDPAKRSLKDRASEVEASAARVIKGRGPVQVTDQGSSEALPRGRSADRGASSFKASEQASHDAGGGVPGRSKAARGQAPRQESAMGRHESFDPTTSVRTSYAPAGAAHSDALSPSGVSVGIRALRDHWRAAHTAAHAPGLSESELNRLGDLATTAEKALIAAPIRSAADLACKVEALREHLGINSLDVDLPHDTILAICRGVELLAYTPKASRQPTMPVEARSADPILQAIDDHRAAFDAANTQPTDELSEAAYDRWQEVYKALQALTPTTPEGVCALAAHLRQFLKDGQNEIGTTFVDEAFTTLLNAIDRFSTTGEPSDPRLAKFDLTGLDTRALDRMFDAYAAVSKSWNALGCLPFIWAGGSGSGSVWEYIDREAVRCALERDRISAELRSRQPRNEEERDTLLSARIKDELLCEGWITDRDLLLEAVKAWG